MAEGLRLEGFFLLRLLPFVSYPPSMNTYRSYPIVEIIVFYYYERALICEEWEDESSGRQNQDRTTDERRINNRIITIN